MRRIRKVDNSPQPLPRGRHGLSPKVVKASQRQRLTQAMLELVAARSYASTTVPEVVAAARVSRNAFYEFFADKEDCFLAACEEEARNIIPVMTSLLPQGDWLDALLDGIEVYLDWWQQRPEMTRAYFVELPLIGARASAQRDRAYAMFIEMFRLLGELTRRQQPDLSPLPAYVPRMLVISITELVAIEVRQGRVAQLLQLKLDLGHYIARLLADDATAERALAKMRQKP